MIYPKAPIVEAIFDVQVELDGTVNLNVFSEIQEKIKNEYPQMTTSFLFSSQIKINPEKSNIETDNNSIEKGKCFHSEDKRRVIQMREDGFTFNMQAPYTNWEDFYKTSSFYFKLYIEKFKIKNIKRVALRYINQFMVTDPIDGLSSVINCIPTIPKGLPSAFSNYYSQIQIPFVDENIFINITQSTLEKKENLLPLLLDIDVYKFDNISLENIDKIFCRLREIKNLAFENSLTQITKDSFK